MEKLRATVVRVVRNGKRPYVICNSEEIQGESVTFGLNEEVWQENKQPAADDEVMLTELVRGKGGWRAMRARLLRVSDEKKQTKKKK